MKPYTILLFFILAASAISARHLPGTIIIKVVNEQQQPVPSATVELLKLSDSSVLHTRFCDSGGTVVFDPLPAGSYLLRTTANGYLNNYSDPLLINPQQKEGLTITVRLRAQPATLKEVNIVGRKQAVQYLPDRTVINVEAGITNTGSTILEVLEKSPGITVDRAGVITLKGRPGVLVTIDNKPVYVTGNDLLTLLGSMNANQAEQIEIIDTPPANFDAAGNAGIINIKIKKNKQAGFNSNLNITFGHGRYHKSNNSLLLNYRNKKLNYFLNYSMNGNKNFMTLYALRTYFQADGKTPVSVLEQNSRIEGSGFNHTLRTGVDYYAAPGTTLGLLLTGSSLGRSNPGTAEAIWLGANAQPDSTIFTGSRNKTRWKNGGINLNLKHQFNDRYELNADMDYLKYDIKSNQYFENTLAAPGGYTEALKGDLLAGINIYTAKLDFTGRTQNNIKWHTGLKASYINTNNLAAYFLLNNQQWEPDEGKTNHFIYKENIQAAYTSADKTWGSFSAQAGLRYEYTGYNANQLGNTVVKDSSFSRKYHTLFPTLLLSWQIDSLNLLSVSGGRRIERPAFQKLNPFVFVINKYTFQQGNPFFKPQYTWHTGFSYSYNNLLSAAIDYSFVKDYFSQIFLADSSGIIRYTEGNVGRMWNLVLSTGLHSNITSWWNISIDVNLSHKNMKANLWRYYTARFTQMDANLINQFYFNKGWGAEISAVYISRSQQDIQEIVLPTGMVSAGISKQLLKNKATLKLTFRDMFYTQRMAGNTYFMQAHEYFSMKRDTRVCSLSFSYRFGKTGKTSPARSGGADTEIERVGNS